MPSDFRQEQSTESKRCIKHSSYASVAEFLRLIFDLSVALCFIVLSVMECPLFCAFIPDSKPRRVRLSLTPRCSSILVPPFLPVIWSFIFAPALPVGVV